MGRGQADSAIYDTAWSFSCKPRTRYSMSDLSILLGVLTRRFKGDVSEEGMLIFRFKFRVFDVVCYKTSNDRGLPLTKTGWFWRKTYIFFITGNYRPIVAGPSGRAVWGVGLRPFACRDCGFDSQWGHGCLFLLGVVCCQVEISATNRSLV